MDELSRRRRAIYTALLNCYDKNNAIAGVELWHREFSNKPLFALQPYISRLLEIIDIQVSRAEIKRYIISALAMDNSGLEQDPLANDSDAFKEVTADEITHDVFTHLMNALGDGLKNHFPDAELKIKIILLQKMGSTGLSNENMEHMSAWLTGDRNLQLQTTLTLIQMQRIFHYLYLVCCEELGPVATDKLVTETVHEVEQLPQATEFSPRNFF